MIYLKIVDNFTQILSAPFKNSTIFIHSKKSATTDCKLPDNNHLT